MPPPLFSIGVPTYNRRELLLQALDSLAKQKFTDFEVIVGNSYTQEVLSAESLGVDDPRIRFVNHPQDMGVIEGYSSLPKMARGRYFTWLADDDCFYADFLQTVYTALTRYDFPYAVFTAYTMGANYVPEENISVKDLTLLTGRQFLREYLAQRLKVVGCYGVFDLQYLIRIGSMELLADGESPYSDNLLAIRSGLLDKVIYIDAPLVFFRAHKDSISYISTDLDSYYTAQKNMCHKCVEIFRSRELREDSNSNFFLLLRWCIRDFADVACRSGSINRRQVIAYLLFVKEHIRLMRWSVFYWKAIGLVVLTAFRLVRDSGKSKLKRWLMLLRKSRELSAKKDNSLA